MVVVLFQKNPNGGLRTYYFFKKNSGSLSFVILPLEILDKTKPYSCKFCKILLHPLITTGNRTSFSVDPENFNMIFLPYPRKFHVLRPSPSCLDFSISPYIYYVYYVYVLCILTASSFIFSV